MKIEDVLHTYDAQYAAEYDETHLFGIWNRESVAFQLSVLEERLRNARNWLDVACGTGWVLSRFPNVQRAGLDISAPMLEVARTKNPGVTFVQRNYRDTFPEWNDRWDVVSCMWWAYCLAETMSEIRELVARLADWTSPQGEVYLPLCNIQKFDRHNIRIPYIDPKVPGRLMITGIFWTWIQENGKRHDNALSPQLDYLIAMFREHFEIVEVIEGPLDLIGEGWRVQDVLLARGKKAIRLPGDLHGQIRAKEPGREEWLLHASEGSLARIAYQAPDLESVRIEIDALGGDDVWAVQVSKRGFRLVEGRQYRIAFRGRADAARPIALGAGTARVPWSGLGFYETLTLTPQWRVFEFTFMATGASDLARVHFDLGESREPVDLADVALTPVER